MEPGAAAAAYGVETAVEGAVGAAVVIAKPTLPLKSSPWRQIPTDVSLPRSSHSLSIVKDKAHIFGGEEKPRQPVPNDMHVFRLPISENDNTDYRLIAAASSNGPDGPVPAPRVGHAAAVVDDRIYVFGGRGGKEMIPLEEQGRVWVFDTRLNQWTFLDPVKGSAFPQPRSYHAAASTIHPVNTTIGQQGSTAGESQTGFDDHGTLFIHGGCPASGRVSDVWGFDIAARTWSQYADAPGPARGGTCLTFTQNRLYRFGGFDGKQELGGSLDFLHFVVNTFDDKGGKGELAVTPLSGQWESLEPHPEASWPGKRSVSGLHPVTTGQGRHYLLLFLGEKDPSSAGHEAAGRFWDDIWSFQLRPEGWTAASFKDATRLLVGAKTNEGNWARVDVPEGSMTAGSHTHPGSRGWFASSPGQDLDPRSVVLWGGVMENNMRAPDGWILTLDT